MTRRVLLYTLVACLVFQLDFVFLVCGALASLPRGSSTSCVLQQVVSALEKAGNEVRVNQEFVRKLFPVGRYTGLYSYSDNTVFYRSQSVYVDELDNLEKYLGFSADRDGSFPERLSEAKSILDKSGYHGLAHHQLSQSRTGSRRRLTLAASQDLDQVNSTGYGTVETAAVLKKNARPEVTVLAVIKSEAQKTPILNVGLASAGTGVIPSGEIGLLVPPHPDQVTWFLVQNENGRMKYFQIQDRKKLKAMLTEGSASSQKELTETEIQTLVRTDAIREESHVLSYLGWANRNLKQLDKLIKNADMLTNIAPGDEAALVAALKAVEKSATDLKPFRKVPMVRAYFERVELTFRTRMSELPRRFHLRPMIRRVWDQFWEVARVQ